MEKLQQKIQLALQHVLQKNHREDGILTKVQYNATRQHVLLVAVSALLHRNLPLFKMFICRPLTIVVD